MANVSNPFGFSEYSGMGTTPAFEQQRVWIQYNASAIYYGDPVLATTGGYVVRAASTGATPSTSTAVYGIFLGCKYLSVSQKRTVWSNYWPGSDVASGNLVEGLVVNHPTAKFRAQTDSTGFSLSAINSTVGFVIGTGNVNNNGISGAYLDSTTLNTSSYVQYAPFKVYDLIYDPPGAQGTTAFPPTTTATPYNTAIVGFNEAFTRDLYNF